MFSLRGARSLLLLGIALISAGSAIAARPGKHAPRRTITVMTRNLYLGADLDPIVHATS